MPLILRSTKGSPLTFNELDGNFTYLSESISEGGGTPPTASYALTAETAATASYFSGSASLIGSLTATPTGVIITGSLIVSGSNTLNNVGPLTTGDINNIAYSNSMAQGKGTSALGDYSHTEGNTTTTGLYAWPSSGPVTNGISSITVNFSSSTGNITSFLPIGSVIFLERFIDSFDKVVTKHTVSSSTFNGTSTQIIATPQITGPIQSVPCAVANESQISNGPQYPLDGTQTIIMGGKYSHAEGKDTLTIGDNSHVTGVGTIALGQGQFVAGTYNTLSDTGSLFIVGRGTADNNRRDAFKVNPIGSITVPTTRSAAPNWTGTDGEMIFATISGNHRFYVWMSGAWRSGSLS